MNDENKNTYPIPYCWYTSYLGFAYCEGLSVFPTSEFLQMNPQIAKKFTEWVFYQSLKPRDCKGRYLKTCTDCENNGCTKEGEAWVELAEIVGDIHPELQETLKGRIEIVQTFGYLTKKPDPPDDPNKSPAVAMDVPKAPLRTKAVADSSK